MTLEAFSEWHIADRSGGWLDPVTRVWAARGWRPGDRVASTTFASTFASHDDAFARARGDDRIAAAFVEETRSMVATIHRDDDGLYCYPWEEPAWQGRAPLLVDAMHEYASRLASAAALGGEPEWYDIAVRQFEGYREVLRDPETGLWHLARDFGDRPGTLSPGAWSRGHGWLLRGCAETLRWLPADHRGAHTLRSILQETVETLAPLQDADGMWHVLLHRPWSDSEAETSGTGLIAYAIARAIAEGHLPRDRWSDVAARAIIGVCARVDQDGTVHGACVTPGLLFDNSESLYLHKPIAPGDEHGPPCVLYACLGARLLEGIN
jgi:rhamnogalacturonyl hydrolase YesR